MNGLQAYRYYMAVKLHFTKDSFDVFKNPNVKCSVSTFEKRHDRYLFEKLAKRYTSDKDLIQYYVSNFAYGHTDVIYEEEESKTIYTKWIARKESISKVLQDDCSKIITYAEKHKITKEEVLGLTGNDIPAILKLLVSNQISIESVRIIDDYFDMIKLWSGISLQFWKGDLRRISKLKKFVRYDKQRIERILLSFKEELNELSSHGS